MYISVALCLVSWGKMGSGATVPVRVNPQPCSQVTQLWPAAIGGQSSSPCKCLFLHVEMESDPSNAQFLR